MQHASHYVRLGSLLAAVLLAGPSSAEVQVRVLGKVVPVSPAPVLAEGRLEGAPLPLTAALGARAVTTGAGTATIIAPDGTRLELTPGAAQILVNDQPVPVAGGVRQREGQIWCALRPVLEALGVEACWDGTSKTLDLWARVRDITVRADADGCEVAVLTSLPVTGRLEQISGPERRYVDLSGAVVSLPHDCTWVSLGPVLRVRWGQFAQSPPVMRVVADLTGSAPALWRPRDDGRGGSLIIGRVDGDEPVISRPQPAITGLTVTVPNERTTRLRVTMTDPLPVSYQVRRQPPQVTLDFPGATMQAAPGLWPVSGPFVESAQLTPTENGVRLTLAMRQLIQFEVRQCDDPATVDVVFKAERLADKRVVLDPGHGGHDTGARGRRLLEKDVNLDVALRAAARLVELGAQVRLTRDSDVFVDLHDRPALARTLGADLFVSIHCNAMPTPNTGHGTETYYYTPQSMCLGQIMQAVLVEKLGRADRGLRSARFVVIREATMPAVLVELMFLNNDQEHALLERPEVRQAAANAICEGLRRYIEGAGTLTQTGELGY